MAQVCAIWRRWHTVGTQSGKQAVSAETRRTPILPTKNSTSERTIEAVKPQDQNSGYNGLLQQYVAARLLTSDEAEFASDLFYGVLLLVLRAHDKEIDAQNQLKAIRKFTYPEDYKLPLKDIARIANKYETKAFLAQGGRIREMMAELSWAVVCVEQGKNVLNGKVSLCEPSEAIGTEEAYDLAAKAFRRLRTKTSTLELLAINVLRNQDPAFKKKSVDNLRRALRMLEKWEQSKESLSRKHRQSWLPVDGGPPLLIPYFTEGWKQRKKGSGGDRKDNGLWDKQAP